VIGIGANKMSTITISVNREKLPPHSDYDFEEWVRFNVRDQFQISLSNPLEPIELESTVVSIKD